MICWERHVQPSLPISPGEGRVEGPAASVDESSKTVVEMMAQDGVILMLAF
jgi:hypothetical protein